MPQSLTVLIGLVKFFLFWCANTPGIWQLNMFFCSITALFAVVLEVNKYSKISRDIGVLQGKQDLGLDGTYIFKKAIFFSLCCFPFFSILSTIPQYSKDIWLNILEQAYITAAVNFFVSFLPSISNFLSLFHLHWEKKGAERYFR